MISGWILSNRALWVMWNMKAKGNRRGWIMLNCLEIIAERRIREAIERGELDNIPGQGKPLKFEDDSWVPADLRMAYKILKNAGFLPPELETEREIKEAVDLIRHLDDERLKYQQVKKLNVLVTKINMMRKRPINLEVDQVYYRKVVDRISVRRR